MLSKRERMRGRGGSIVLDPQRLLPGRPEVWGHFPLCSLRRKKVLWGSTKKRNLEAVKV